MWKTLLCNHIMKMKDNDKNIFQIWGEINCKTLGVIYCTFVPKVKKNMHFGQTEDIPVLYFFLIHSVAKLTRKQTL